MFQTLIGVLNTCQFIKFFKLFKTLHISASIGHPQVLKLFVERIAVIFLGIHAFTIL
jgi:hypothetical protein